MNLSFSKATWIWHPGWIERADETSAGGFVHFRRSVTIQELPAKPVLIQITADTRYKLYINSRLVCIGPVKGDEHLWFYDEVDIQGYLKAGTNHFAVRVLRFYYASLHATSFPRLPFAGLLIRNTKGEFPLTFDIQSGSHWETALDMSTRLPTDIKEDDFLHVYEDVDKRRDIDLKWVPAKELKFPASHGLSFPWRLSPRLIPVPQCESKSFKELHNIRSTATQMDWESALLNPGDPRSTTSIRLPAGTSHHVELEVEHHVTAKLDFRFERPTNAGSTMKVTYSECYEDAPEFVPYIRRKGDRCDSAKMLIGPEDKYIFGGKGSMADLRYYETTNDEEIFSPFHFRTLRFIALDIDVAEESDLVFKGITLSTTNYPLRILADFNTVARQDATMYRELWTVSIRTLMNCMHDCYEDCPFYEQLQYAMDVRSSALFTYCLSGDDRVARQAIIQLHNSYDPSLGLTASRAPAHQYQVIPHFSLFWVSMITDHFEHFGDSEFARQFMPACDGVFESFARRCDPELGLVRSLDSSSAQWDFVDWTNSWRPMGIPPAAERTGFQTYTNMLYAYSLKRVAELLVRIGRPGLAAEYQSRAEVIVKALQTHCFDGHFFTDGLAVGADPEQDLSLHNQIWAVLCGAATGSEAVEILTVSLSSAGFTPTSIAMSFYTLRALSMVGGNLYNEHFHAFWEPWRTQLSHGLTTWVEDSVSQRSDCHAWGSAPIYEFLAEVAGIRPAAPGWAVIAFQPRVSLLPELDAKIPFGVKERSGIAYVKWRHEEDHVKVSLSLKMHSAEVASVPVRVTLPEKEVQMMDCSEGIFLVLKL